MSSAGVAVTLFALRQGSKLGTIAFGLITLIFFYTTVTNIIERPDGIRIATFFITIVIITSLISRVFRSTELRVSGIELDETAQQFIDEMRSHPIRLIAHRRTAGTVAEYRRKEQEIREDNHLPLSESILFLEVKVYDASVFADLIRVQGVEVGEYRVLRVQSAAVPNAIAALLLYIRDQTVMLLRAYFGWSEGNPIQYLLRFIVPAR